MSTATRYKINRPQVVHENFDDEVVLINFDTGNYFSFNHVGATIWASIKKEMPVKTILEDLVSRFKGSREIIQSGLNAFLDQLETSGLIVATQATEKPSGGSPDSLAEPESPIIAMPFKAPVLHQYDDMQELLLLDPIHEVDESGWPNKAPGPTTG